MIGKTKGAALKNDEDFPDAIAFSVHDQNLAYFIYCDGIYQLGNFCKTNYDANLNKKVNLTYLCANAYAMKNFNGKNVDISDKRRGHYCFDKWCRNNEWWISFLFLNHRNVNINICVGANVNSWLAYEEKDKAKHLHYNHEFKKGSCMEKEASG